MCRASRKEKQRTHGDDIGIVEVDVVAGNKSINEGFEELLLLLTLSNGKIEAGRWLRNILHHGVCLLIRSDIGGRRARLSFIGLNAEPAFKVGIAGIHVEHFHRYETPIQGIVIQKHLYCH